MDPNIQAGAIRELKASNKRLGLVIVLMGITCVALALGMLKVAGSERTVLVPPNFTKTFWVNGSKVSAEYLEEMGGFVSWLILDVSPSTLDWKKEILLKFTNPDQYGAMKTKQELELARLRKLNASTFFNPTQIVVDEPAQRVDIRGQLRTQINGQDTSAEPKAYSAKFVYAGGRVHLDTFKEIPYASKPGQTAAADSGDRAAN